jgi:hypothetical protein
MRWSTTATPLPTRKPLFARLLPGGNLAGSLYGTVLVTSVLVAFSGSDRAGPIIAAVIVTTVVFALAHAWAHALGRSGAERRPLDRHALRHAVGHEWSIVEAALPAIAVLALAAFGLYTAATGLWIAVLLNVGLLFVWGVGVRRLAGGSSLQALGAGLASAALGLVLVLLKILVH